ncbi:aminotransferase class I/II-fold pyridoxal phosphate-dependent enzyme [Parvimonas micra]|uniref:aminotransferase class I/II-fold pyridoxal phosphate-dependent enzyme n=1 Tax=Parvimonas micra TaxID=33033 RepID=UPI0022B74019|nr:aminotransferase class I/II-fold pyridoxal phosphate-dependent enzyme [Parvimonas micra]WBB31686.1 aminotransferase class I/II-fold pyridoxal phosphate-dependent enzyme [Parvimonas micra]WBB34658.1 aminotransferase class I/II-fold pyridoxal phosphate-dependent enzyme [Parvimonas micra]WBB36179.1 aminotransferase class I/II-fold pyridoxal phosphate-dependent enzyme [Parvimonas micra]
MQAVILAAGLGSRLKKLTENNTKSMVEVNGISLMERMLRILDTKSLSNIVVVTGYKSEFFINYMKSLNINTKLTFINNEIYDKTNNIYSMFLAKNEMINEDSILLESDLIFDDEMITEILEDNRKNLALVAKYERWMDGTCLKINENEEILDFIPGKDFNFEDADNYFKTINIYKFSKEFSKNIYFPFLEAYMSANGKNDYYEAVLKTIIDLGKNYIYAKVISDDIKWYEIDDEQDLNIASSIFSNGDEKLEKYQIRYGGYWRYPKLLDFCYLVNPYFPPKKMIDELKYNFKVLLEQYPSGLDVNSSLVAKIFDIKKENIVVGNGAAELIKSVIEKIDGSIGFIRPTFEEYPNRHNSEKSIVFIPKNDNFSYTAKDIIEFYSDKDIEALVLINPDNPTGNYICKKDIFTLIDWARGKKIKFILDESFVDFAEEENSTFLDDKLLNLYDDFIVVKSISKSYGVPGIRLGIVATSNSHLISMIKKDVSIWNINSFGEYYLQIYDKYKKVYANALVEIKNARKIFLNELNKIEELRVVPSQANYFTIELKKGNSKELCSKMLENYNIFIKDLTSKINLKNREFIRVAVRNIEDNEIFVSAVKDYFKNI